MTEILFARKDNLDTLSGYFSGGILAIAHGGTGASTAATARSNLGAIAEVVEDTSPSLGGNLDADSNSISNVNGLTITDANGIDVNPGSDTDTDLLSVGVTGSPKLVWDETGDAFKMAAGLIVGDPGNEAASITVAGGTYNSVLKVSDIGGSNAAQLIFHRHSTTLPSLIVGSRSHSDTNSHAVVQDNDGLLTLYGAGHDGTDYELGAAIEMLVDGTPGDNDMPGEIAFFTNAGSQTLTKRLSIRADGSFEFNSNALSGIASLDIDTGGSLTINSTSILSDSAGTATLSNIDALDSTTETTIASALASTYQPLDGELTALAGLTSAADKVPYFTGSGTASLASFTSYGRSIVAVADEAAFKALVNLEIGTDVAAAANEASFSATKGGTDQTGVVDVTFTQITFGTEEYDNGSYFASNAWTPPAGIISVKAGFQATGTITAGNQIGIAIYKNGSIWRQAIYTCSTNVGSAFIVADDNANGSDSYTVYGYIDVDSGTGTFKGDTQKTFFQGHFLS